MDGEIGIALALTLAAGLIGTGAIAGVLAGLLGVGGGIVIVPVLFWLTGALGLPEAVAMHMAVATSLATIIPTSIASARAHRARGAFDAGLFGALAPAIFAGAALGGLASAVVGGTGLSAIFGCVALAVAVNMARPRPRPVADGLPRGALPRAGLGGTIGGISALMGIGGGTLSVPALTLCGVPVHRAVGTASAFGLVIAVPAVAGFVASGWGVADRPAWSLGYVSLPAAALILAATVLTAPLGTRLAHAIDATALKRAFALFLGLTALRMLWVAAAG